MKLTQLFKEFFQSERTGGLILVICTIISLLIANSSLSHEYDHLWHLHINLSFGQVDLNHSLEEWINDGLMAVFFLLVGLEIERELYSGELSQFRNAILPILAAIGGMAIPSLTHFLFNHGKPTQQGIGIPMATDIAFSLGILSLLGNRVPVSLKIFLTALAIIDDLGAIIIIAVFYSRNLSLFHLFLALSIFVILVVLNRLKVYSFWIYLAAGAIMWYFMFKSGIHAAITGVLLAFAIPFRNGNKKNPSDSWERALHKPVNYFIVPLFALANTGIHIPPDWYPNLRSNNSLGIMMGLVVGKPLGVFSFSWIATKLKWARLPYGINWKILFGSGVLAGIGFTMSIFITNLAFKGDPTLVLHSKIAILLASLSASTFGLVILSLVLPKKIATKHPVIAEVDG
ncbi:MAG: Na+/H+ antiporter NhaA [Bacteroidetes bacterium]|nr:MAG: Na+/H+ antiporter NhaA [Bacteroidota bacterium]